VDYDLLTLEHLRARGDVKWERYPHLIGAWVAEMDFGTAPPIVQAMQTAVEGGSFGYQQDHLVTSLSAACAAWQRDAYGWEVPASAVHRTSDVIRAFETFLDHFTRPGSPVILCTPAYMPFLRLPAVLGRSWIDVPMLGTPGEGWTLDLDGIDAAFAAGAGSIMLCNPHNPLGKVYTRAELEALSEVVARHPGARVFSDEIHAPIIFDGLTHVPYATVSDVAAEQVFTATSASKGWNLPGLKCAQIIVTAQQDRETWDRVGFFASHGASTIGMIANTAAYTSGGRWQADVLAYLEGSRDLLTALVAEHLPGVGFRSPDGTYLAWLDMRETPAADAPAAFFEEHAGVRGTEGAECGPVGAGFFRYNFATPRPIMERTIVAMADALAGR